MKIKNEVRYALQIIYYLTLHRDKEIISSSEISEEEQIPRLFCLRIIKKLEKAGVVKIFRGAKGGYVLTRDPKRLTFRDIIEIIDDDIVLQPCIDSTTICSTRGNDCAIRIALKEIQDALLADFDEINFYDLAEKTLSQTE
ncbi:Rrf2 family transcriptional regulator [Fusobacterium massiliense]|jgi:transcriptional regulator, Rrf2 family|uniref:RrF2 family transcriptional regulator n=1 Tax=Fusobacterium massiliense TaxID=1852365 RepID=UPI00093DBF0F|nr:Rrf2 family transcriptional regulator [Fusobacterium massiliense]